MSSQIIFHPHSRQQADALRSKSPITLLATGIQFGKTTIGALWLFSKMIEFSNEEDNFIVCSPTYKILQQSTLPPILRYMDGYGQYHRQDQMFEMSGGGRCYFRTGTDPDSIVGITNVRAIYGDEAGLFSLYFWENIQARAAFKSAPVLLTTSPYTLNWVYKDLIRPKQRYSDARPDVCYIKARSIDNPHFPRDYYERMRETMDDRRFRAMFGGEWEKMEGLVYDCFDEELNSIQPFSLPPGTIYYGGIDWGTTAPFALVVRAITPDGEHYQVSEIYKTGLTILDMIQMAKAKCQAYPIKLFYCDPSNPGYIMEFNRSGLAAVGANNEIRVGIDLHYDLIRTRRYKLFRGDNKHSIDEYETYHYPSLEETKQDTKIVDNLPVKQHDHACFVAETPILTPDGYKEIQTLKAGGMVRTTLGDFEILDAWSTGIKPVATYRFSDGRKITATSDHPFYVFGRGFTALSQIGPNDILPIWNDQEKSLLMEKTIGFLGLITGAVERSFIGRSISTTMEKFPRTTISIMWILIRLTMIPVILWRFLLLSISLYMQERSAQRGEKSSSSTLDEPAILQKLGTAVKRAVNGIKNMRLKLFLKENLEPLSVLTAPKALTLGVTRFDFARTVVGLLLDVRVVSMILIENALSVLRLSKLINMHAPKLVRICAVESSLVEQRVFSLRIRHSASHITNGFYTGNCDANRYVTTMTYTGDYRKDPQIISPNEEKKPLSIYERAEKVREPIRTYDEEW